MHSFHSPFLFLFHFFFSFLSFPSLFSPFLSTPFFFFSSPLLSFPYFFLFPFLFLPLPSFPFYYILFLSPPFLFFPSGVQWGKEVTFYFLPSSLPFLYYLCVAWQVRTSLLVPLSKIISYLSSLGYFILLYLFDGVKILYFYLFY